LSYERWEGISVVGPG